MTRIYIAGPLFSKAELDFNEDLNGFLIKQGYCTFLPQKDGMELEVLLSNGMPKEEAMQKIFELDIKEVLKCDILLLIMDGRIPDEGACVELGLAFGVGKKCVGIKTDVRSMIDGLDNPMIIGCLQNRIANDFVSLNKIICELVQFDSTL